MSYDVKGLYRIAAGGAIGIGANSVKSTYSYHTNDDAAAVETSGYFNGAAALFSKGDIILAALDIDGTPALRSYVVSANDGATVTITRGTATAAA